MKTWEVKLDTASNGLVQMNVEADDFEAEDAGGVTFHTESEEGGYVDVAFFPLARLISVKDVTP